MTRPATWSGKVGALLALVLLGVTALGVLAAPALVYLLASGFAQTPGKIELTADLIRIVFPYILFVSLVSLAGGVLNVYRRFAVPAFTPVLLNLSIIGVGDLSRPLFRPADQGARVGRVHRRYRPARVPDRAARADRHAAAPAHRLARPGRAPRAAGTWGRH